MMHKRRVPLRVINKLSERYLSSSERRPEEILKNIVKPERVPIDYWKRLIWMAMSLKKTMLENNKASLNILQTKHVTLMYRKPHGRFQVAYSLACDLLGVRKTLYYDDTFEHQTNAADNGKVLSRITDMIVILGISHSSLKKLIVDATVPIFPASCNIYSMQKALSEVMTILYHTKRLKGLTLAWIGPPSSLFNAYLVLGSRFGINMKYVCLCKYGSGRVSPVHVESKKQELFDNNEKTMKEFETIEEAISGAHIVVTAAHPEGKAQVNLDLLQLADKNWFYMPNLPRSATEASTTVFNHERNLAWEASENYLYMAMAVILTCLKDECEPNIQIPDFDGVGKNDIYCTE